MFANATAEQLFQLEQIIEHLDCASIVPPFNNRRAAPRMKIRTPMTAILLASAGLPSIVLFSRNLSRSGIGFISRRPFSPGDQIGLSIHLPNQPHKLLLTKITFARYVRAGVYEIGATFIECIADFPGKNRIPHHWIPAVPRGRTASHALPHR